MGVTDQGAREARYAEAIHHATEQATLGWPQESLRLFVEPILREVLAVADAEVAAAVSEAQAERETLVAECERYGLPVGLAGLLRHLEGSRAMTVAGWQLASEAWQKRAESAEAEVERLREGIRALHTKGYASTSEEVWGQNPQCDECGVTWPCDTIALLAPSPAATTGEHDEPLPDYLKELQRPALVSSGEAGHYGTDPTHGGLTQHRGRRSDCASPDCGDPSGEAEQLQGSAKLGQDLELGEAATGEAKGDLCDGCRSWTCVHNGCRNRPAPVVTPSAEGSE